MKIMMMSAVLTLSLFSLPAAAESITPKSLVNSSAGSVASSFVAFSGLVFGPVAIPVVLITGSVESGRSNKNETVITAKTEKDEPVTMVVATDKLAETPISPGDKLSLEPVEKGTGAYLKKDGKIISHMITPADAELHHQEKMP